MGNKTKKLREQAERVAETLSYMGELLEKAYDDYCDIDSPNNEQSTDRGEFVMFMCNKFDELKAQFLAKNAQYATNSDPVANFRTGSKLNGGTGSYAEMFEEAKAYQRKHIGHVANNNVYGNKVDESLTDIAIYSLIELYFLEKAKEEKAVAK